MAFEYAIALTGSIATGKSTVATMLSSLGFDVIDADDIAHNVLHEQHKVIAKIFGEELVENKKVDRKALGLIVFSDKKKRKQLEALLHPLIFNEIKKYSIEKDKEKKIYFIDIPLFFETKNYPIEKSLVVYASKEKQLERLMRRNGYNEQEALSRMNAQISIEEKRKWATYVVDNSKDLASVKKEVLKTKEQIVKDFL